jgi:hypothetical protein
MHRATPFAAALLLFASAPPSRAEEPAATAPARPRATPASKTLEITTIEGQILFPKVLFIAAEEPARYPQTLHRVYWGTALDLGRATRLPKHIVIGATPSPAAGGEMPAARAPSIQPEPATSSPVSAEVNP